MDDTQYYINDIVEVITQRFFESTRPEWLVDSQTGRKMKLECYNDALKIAAEFRSYIHYTRGLYHNSIEPFDEINRLDKEKERLCQENGVLLIIIPYTMSRKSIKNYIRDTINSVSLSTLCLRTIALNKIDTSKLSHVFLT